MNTLLTKHIEAEEGKTHAQSVAEYAKAWENSRYLLRPLAKMLKERKKATNTVNPKDFDIPNHYAKLMYEKGKEEEIDLFLSLLPKSLED